jgi:hypothetical protein
VTPLEKTVCFHAFIAYRSGIRLYWLREETRAAESGPGPGSSSAASGTRAGTCACTRACETSKEVGYRGIEKFTPLSWPPSGGLFFGKERHISSGTMPSSLYGSNTNKKSFYHGRID